MVSGNTALKEHGVPDQTGKINYYNREEAFLAKDSTRLGETILSIEEKAYDENGAEYLEQLLAVGAINFSEYKRLQANAANVNKIYWTPIFTSVYGITPTPSSGESGSGSVPL